MPVVFGHEKGERKDASRLSVPKKMIHHGPVSGILKYSCSFTIKGTTPTWNLGRTDDSIASYVNGTMLHVWYKVDEEALQ